MEKQHNTSEISRLINPLILNKFDQQSMKCMESGYLTNKTAPLGKSPVLNFPVRASELRFGIITNKGDLASDLLHPFIHRSHQSVYSTEFVPFAKSNDGINPAGLNLEVPDSSGQQIKEIFTMSSNSSKPSIIPSSRIQKPHSDKFDALDDTIVENTRRRLYINEDKAFPPNDSVKILSRKFGKERHLLEILWNLIKKKNHCCFEDLTSAFYSYTNGTDKITVADLQKMCQKFGISVPQHIYEKLLQECDIIDKDGAISYDEFVYCLNWKALLRDNTKLKKSEYAGDWRENCINCNSENSLDHFKTTYSLIGDHSCKEPIRSAGLPSLRNDLLKPELKSVADFHEYGDVKNGAEIIQPNIFAKYGVYDDDLNVPQTKQEIKVLFNRSGINFNSEMFEIVWKTVSKNGKASILSVWNKMKKLCSN